MSRLSEEQLEAVLSESPGLRVSACPGSGKTTVLVERSARMLHAGIKPESLLAITFTNKAAAEMKTRLVAKVGEKAKKVRFGTINSVCLEIIRRITGSNPRQASAQEMDLAIQTAAQENNIQVRDASSRITRAKAKGDISSDPVAMTYQVLLDQQSLIDFDDQLIKALQLLRSTNWGHTFPWRHILVDEAQDLNPVQADIVTALASLEGATLFMVGDPDQAVYGFRGADPELFIKRFQSLDLLRLSYNFRSGSALVGRAALLASDTFRPAVQDQGLLAWHEERDKEADMAATVARIKAEPVYKDVAVLTRTNSQALTLAIMLREADVPVLDEDNILDVNRYRHLKAIMTVVDDPRTKDREAFFMAAGLADKFLGMKFKEAVDRAQRDDITLWDACQEPMPAKWLTRGAEKFRAMIRELRETYRRTQDVQITLREAAIKTDFLGRFDMDEDDHLAILRLAAGKTSIKAFIQAMTEFTAKMENGVRILTAHRSKGLEFPVVYVPNLNQGVFPHTRADSVAEEGRLLYAAITRAQKRLVLSWSAKTPSPFLKALALPLVETRKVLFGLRTKTRRIATGFEGETLPLAAAA